MIHGEKLYNIFEQAVNEPENSTNPRGLNGYRERLRAMLGIVEQADGGMSLDLKTREMDPREFSFAEVAQEFLPRRFRAKDVPAMIYTAQQMRMTQIAEAEGYVVLPSHFSAISAFSDTVAGLMDAMILEGYMEPDYNGDDFFETVESRMNGGKMIGVMNDGEAGDDLLDGEPYPTVGLKETFVDIPDNKRRGNTIQLNLKTLIYDRTDQIQDACVKAGNAVKRIRHLDQGRVFMGITNTYSRDGNASNTYLDARGDIPNDYINSALIDLEDWTDIDEAVQIMESNTDPGTGFEVEFGEPYAVAVMPQQWLKLQTIVRATEVETRTQSAVEIRRASNPLYSIAPMKLSRSWYNLLLASLGSGSDTNAPQRWWLAPKAGFKKAFKYRQIIPFQSNEAPLSSEDVRRDIILIRVAMEHGVAFTAEPRYAGMFSVEDLTP